MKAIAHTLRMAALTIQSLPLLTWKEIRDHYDREYGKNHHHLRMHCTQCGNTATCRCSEPKVDEYGICPECVAKIPKPSEQYYDMSHDNGAGMGE